MRKVTSTAARAGAIALAASMLALLHAAPQAPASLAGTVVSAGAEPQPMRRALVTLSGPALTSPLSAVTDDEGRFAFVNLRPGRYGVTAAKPAYLASSWGAREPGRPGSPVALAAGRSVTDLRLVLVRGAVVSGLVRDAVGAPVANVPITVSPAASAGGASVYESPQEGPVLTDDQGMYRAYGLAPGEYLIAASPRSPGREPFMMLPASAIDGLLRDLQQRASGRGLGASPAPSVAPQPATFAPVFYPGTPNVAEAGRVRLAAGEVREGLDFTVDLVPAVEIRGRVVMGDGSSVPGTQLTLTPIGPPLPRFASLGVTLRQNPDGSFVYSSVTPGRYVLYARGTPGAPATTTGGRGGVSLPAPQAGLSWAAADLDVTSAGLDGLTLALRPAAIFAGRVAFDGGAPTPPEGVSRIRVGLVRVDEVLAEGRAVLPGLPAPAMATVAGDGTFSVSGVLPGLYVPSALVPGMPDVRLRSAMAGGRDLLDIPLDLTADPADVSGAVLTFSDRHAELSGTLQDAAGRAAVGYTVIVFPADRALWRAARRLQAAPPASDGHFSFSGLPGGEYRLAAVTEIPVADWRRPSFLEAAAAASVPVTLADGARATQDLRIP